MCYLVYTRPFPHMHHRAAHKLHCGTRQCGSHVNSVKALALAISKQPIYTQPANIAAIDSMLPVGKTAVLHCVVALHPSRKHCCHSDGSNAALRCGTTSTPCAMLVRANIQSQHERMLDTSSTLWTVISYRTKFMHDKFIAQLQIQSRTIPHCECCEQLWNGVAISMKGTIPKMYIGTIDTCFTTFQQNPAKTPLMFCSNSACSCFSKQKTRF